MESLIMTLKLPSAWNIGPLRGHREERAAAELESWIAVCPPGNYDARRETGKLTALAMIYHERKLVAVLEPHHVKEIVDYWRRFGVELGG